MGQGVRLAVIIGVLGCSLSGFAVGGGPGAVVGLLMGILVLAARWWGQPLWSWAYLYLNRDRPIALSRPVSAANHRSAAGVRYQNGVVVTAIEIIGKPFQPTFFSGSTSAVSSNVLDVDSLFGHMRQGLGLAVESISVINAGARHYGSGDFPKTYDTLVGTPPYAGQRETWLMVRIRLLDNAEALRWRQSAGSAAVSAAQRIAADLRHTGMRARVATAAEISALDRRLGSAALEPNHCSWAGVRDTGGWLTSYTYRPADITTESLAQAWTLRADGIIQNITLLPDRTVTASLTVRTSQRATTPPRATLNSRPGQQAAAVANNLAGPNRIIRGQRHGKPGAGIGIPIGPSGVLLGRIADGSRIALPLVDPRESSRIRIEANDVITKRILIRAAAAGERITIHSTNRARWESVRMPNLVITSHPRPVHGTTISVQDGTVAAVPRPRTVIAVMPSGSSDSVPTNVVVEQTAPSSIRVSTSDRSYDIDIDLFRVENRYAADTVAGSMTTAGGGTHR